MAKPGLKIFRRLLKSSLGRFLAIAGISLLGCGFLAGIQSAAPLMRNNLNTYLNDSNYFDAALVSSLGFGKVPHVLQELDGVERFEAVKTADVTFNHGDLHGTARVSNLSEDTTINKPLLLEGSLPQQKDEIVVSENAKKTFSLEVGDIISLTESPDTHQLDTTEFKVVGFVNSPLYIYKKNFGTTTVGSGTIEVYFFTTDGAFADNAVFNMIYLRAQHATSQFGTQTYNEESQDLLNQLDDKLAVIAQERRDEITTDAQEELDSKKSELESQKADVQKQIDEGQQKIDETKDQLDDAQNVLDSGYDQISSALSTLTSQYSYSMQQINDAELKLNSKDEDLKNQLSQIDFGIDQIKQQRSQLESSHEQLIAALSAAQVPTTTLSESKQAIQSKIAEIDSALQDPKLDEQEQLKQQYEQQKSQLEYLITQIDTYQAAEKTLTSKADELLAQRQQVVDGLAQVKSAKEDLTLKRNHAIQQLNSASDTLRRKREELDSKRGEITSAQESLQEGIDDLNSKKSESDEKFSDADEQLEHAQDKINDIDAPEVYLMNASDNLGASMYKQDADRIEAIATFFPSVFFLVSALVTLTTMTRMVDEYRTQTGLLKALGYSTNQASRIYYAYAACSTLLGAILGVALLTQLLPSIIITGYAQLYSIPVPQLPYMPSWPIVGIAISAGLIVSLLATALAILATTREKPAYLLLPKAPIAGKRILLERITPLWKKLSFSNKVMLRNLFRFKRRLFMTIAGIAGCTALMLMAFGLQDALVDTTQNQFDVIEHYSEQIRLTSSNISADMQATTASIKDIDPQAQLMWTDKTNLLAQDAHGEEISVTSLVPQDARLLNDFYTLRTRQGHEPLTFNDNAVIISEKLADKLDVSVGDTIALTRQNMVGKSDGVPHEFTITGIAEFYINNMIFIGKYAWQSSNMPRANYSTLYLNSNASIARYQDAFAEKNLNVTIHELQQDKNTMLEALGIVKLVVGVLIVSAAALAAIVLFNITTISLSERTREIATLKVLGFTRKECDTYLFREILLASIVAAALGLILGRLLLMHLIQTVELNYLMFGRQVHLLSYLLSYVLTVGFTLILCFALRYKLHAINMVESLKSVD